MWYAVLRKGIEPKGTPSKVFIGALAIRHQPYHASLLGQGWEEVPVDQIGVPRGEE